jgi:hypothetical protein
MRRQRASSSASFLFGVTAKDPTVFVAAPLLLTAVALIGVWFPARHARNVSLVSRAVESILAFHQAARQ